MGLFNPFKGLFGPGEPMKIPERNVGNIPIEKMVKRVDLQKHSFRKLLRVLLRECIICFSYGEFI